MLSDKIKELYKITNELEAVYPGRKFTIDGQPSINSLIPDRLTRGYSLSILTVPLISDII